MKAPKKVIELCHRLGIEGVTIYIPKKTSSDKQRKKELFFSLLEEIETMYEMYHETLLTNKPQSFTVRSVRYRYKVATHIALAALKSALNTWRRWFKKYESKKFYSLSPQRRTDYLRIRNQIRTKISQPQEKDAALSALARESIDSCPWRL